MKKLLIAAAAIAAISAPAFAESVRVKGEGATPVTSQGVPDSGDASKGTTTEGVVIPSDDDSLADTVDLASNQVVNYNPPPIIPEEIPYGLRLRNAEILYDQYND